MSAHHPEVTAVVMSPEPVQIDVPGALVINHVSRFTTVPEYSRQRVAAIRKVRTERFVCIDSDDELPVDFADVLADCMAVAAPLVYTDELVRQAGRPDTRRQGHEYDQQKHIRNPLLVHHLAVCDTEAAHAALDVLPGGDMLIDMLLYFQLAKGGAVHVPRIGYHWNRGIGMHTWTDNLRCMVNSATWCARNKQ